MGGDGKAGGGNSNIGRDAYGFSLNYFSNDYKPKASANPFAKISIANDLFNGNINSMVVNLPKLDTPKVYGYKYDQLNRLVAMDAYNGLNNTTNVFTPVSINDYKERIAYDANGNIQKYLRNGDASRLNMDSLSYSYKPNTNQLDMVREVAPDAATGEYDKYNDIKQGQQSGNYQYDEIGNLIADASEGISNITWTVYGKISTIIKTNGANITYTYDASGNRISKTVSGKQTWYVRDASGNVMSIYSKDASINSGDLTQTEIHLYGSSRLGVLNLKNDVENRNLNTGRIITFTRGNKFFELSNHLGNVLATVSDKKLQYSSDNVTIDYFTADVVSAQDYYPFGMLMPGRKYSVANTNYRYGFNGKENDNSTGEGNLDFGDRVLDTRLGGRWLSLDPLMKKYPGESPYLFAGGNPILFMDADGRDRIVSLYALTAKGDRILLSRTTYKQSYEVTYGVNKRIHIWETGHYYQADIEETVVIDFASKNIIENYRKEGATKPISMADYYWGPDKKPSMSQSKGKGSYQSFGYYITGNSNGENIDFIDKAGETLGSMDFGRVFDLLTISGADPSVLFESFDRSALENILTGLEKIKATKETQEVIGIIKDNVNKILGNKGKSPANSATNTKPGTGESAKVSTQNATSTKGKEPIADSIPVQVNWNGRTRDGKQDSSSSYMENIVNPKKKKGGDK